MISKVISTIKANGFHGWPNAPEHLDYLRSRHRHLFTIRIEAAVSHDDRELEFHEMQRDLRAAMGTHFDTTGSEFEFGARSCEHIAKEVAEIMAARAYVLTAVEVWEDDECGARLEL